MRAGFAALGVVVGAGFCFLAPVSDAGAGTGGTLYVNATSGHDTGTCRLNTHPCQTIAYALTQATANSTISASGGNYPQQLVISSNVTISGSTSASNPTVIDPSTLTSDTDTDSTTPQDALVDVISGAKVKLKNLTVDGTSASGQFTSCAADFVGVYYHDASGSLTKVAVTNINLPPAYQGCQSGQGIYVASDSGQNSAVTMKNDAVNTYDKNGITCDDIGTTCTITGTTVTGSGPNGVIAQNGIQFFDAQSGTISDSTVTGDAYTGGTYAASGLLIYDVGTITISGNQLTDSDVNDYMGSDGTGPTAGTWAVSDNTISGATDGGDGIQVDSTANTVDISGNTITGSANNGISLYSTSGVQIGHNTTSSNGSDGIYVGGPGSTVSTASTDNTVLDNTAKKNGQNGIDADTLSSSNTFSGNTLTKNVGFDALDQGSGNHWTGNTCKPANDSDPAGLCS